MAALSRRIDWSCAMRDMRRDHAPSNAGSMARKSIEAARLARLSSEATAAPMFVNGCYDRSAIMKAAVAWTRAKIANGTKSAWKILIAVALRLMWIRAKADFILASAH